MSETEKPTNEQLLVEAEASIERIRKSDVKIYVKGNDGKPVSGVQVELVMKNHRFLFGVAPFEALADQDEDFTRNGRITPKLLDQWDKFRAYAGSLFNYATLPVYWGHYEQERGVTREEKLKALWRWCKSCGMKTKAHPVVWHQSVPQWLPDDWGKVRRLMRERVARLVDVFGDGGQCPLDFIDFINEPSGAPENFTNPMAKWFVDMGPDGAVDEAWEACAGFGLEQRGVINHYLRDETFLGVVGRLVERGRRPYGVGLQSHQMRGTRPLWNFVDDSRDFARVSGAKVHWTENSIVSGENRFIEFGPDGAYDVTPWPSTKDGETKQARELIEQYTVLFGLEEVEAVTQWNFTDACSWLSAPSGMLDVNLDPKPSYEALKQLIYAKWWSRESLIADQDGCCTARVFHGDYEVKVIGDGIEEVITTGVDGKYCEIEVVV